MNKSNPGIILLFFVILLASSFIEIHKWGFFGHRRINRLAVFTLVPEMMPLFKKNIEYLTDHAVDPDKRRYMVKGEASRHFIDLNRWGKYPFDSLPRKYIDALIGYGDFRDLSGHFLLGHKSILKIKKTKYISTEHVQSTDTNQLINFNQYRLFLLHKVLPAQYGFNDFLLDGKDLNRFLFRSLADTTQVYRWVDTFSIHGLLPYYFPSKYQNLVDAFKGGDQIKTLRSAAELGHYIADAHVPLHTTSNYDGQLTDQNGIHAFWESRIPELFADAAYDFFVGKAEYIHDVDQYIWNVVIESNQLVDSVLTIEKRLSAIFPADQQYCFDNRVNLTIRTQCEDYARSYQKALHGMVEKRMKQAIIATGSIWYSAWVDAGQPRLKKMIQLASPPSNQEDTELDKAFKNGKMIGRPEN